MRSTLTYPFEILSFKSPPLIVNIGKLALTGWMMFNIKKSKRSEAQLASSLKEQEHGRKSADICREPGTAKVLLCQEEEAFGHDREQL